MCDEMTDSIDSLEKGDQILLLRAKLQAAIDAKNEIQRKLYKLQAAIRQTQSSAKQMLEAMQEEES